MSYYVYILFSEKLQKFYVGTTDDIDQRLIKHNSAYYSDAFTAKGIPWNLYLTITCENSQLAYQLESFIKKMKSSDFIRRLKDNPLINESIIQKIESGGGIGIPKPRERRT